MKDKFRFKPKTYKNLRLTLHVSRHGEGGRRNGRGPGVWVPEKYTFW